MSQLWFVGARVPTSSVSSCSSDVCGLYLCLWSLLELWERAGQGEDDEVVGVAEFIFVKK